MKRWIVRVGGLCAVAAAGVVAWGLTTQHTGGVVFSPAAGTTVEYQLGHRVAVRERADEQGPAQRWVQTYGLMRYHVEDFGDARQLHISPRTLNARNKEEYLFTTDVAVQYRPHDLERLQHDGFDMPFDDDGALALARPRSPALTALADTLNTPAGHPLLDQLVVPALPPALAKSLKARVGAQYMLAHYRGLTHIRATVEQVDDDALTIRLESTDQTRAGVRDEEQRESDAPRMLGRVRVNRHDGWIESMTLVRRDCATRDGRAVAIDRVTRAQRKRNLVTGDEHTLSDPFWYVTDDPPRDVKLRQASTDSREPKPIVDDPAFNERETALRTQRSRLQLAVRFDEQDTRLPLDTVALTDLALYDREDRAIELPIELTTVMPAWDVLTFGDNGRVFIYTLLESDFSMLEHVTRAEARLTYRPPQRQIVTIALDDQPHTLDNGPAQATVEPDAESDNVWWLRLESRDGFAYQSALGRTAPGVHALAGVAPHDSWVSAAQAELLAQVDSPSARVETVRVQADHAPAEYPLLRLTPGEAREYTVEFKRRESP